MSMSRHYVLAAGGTGGHMMPAHALAEELRRLPWRTGLRPRASTRVVRREPR